MDSVGQGESLVWNTKVELLMEEKKVKMKLTFTLKTEGLE